MLRENYLFVSNTYQRNKSNQTYFPLLQSIYEINFLLTEETISRIYILKEK
jgi:hypothetical protein